MKPQDPFESQLNEILDSGLSEQSVPEKREQTSPNGRIEVFRKKQSSTKAELLLRIAGGIALIGLLLGFALRIALF